MLINIITIFPEFFESPLSVSIPKRAIQKDDVSVEIYDLRDYTTDKHRTVDDIPFGGGPGMIMKPEPWSRALTHIPTSGSPIIYMTPQGETLTQKTVETFAATAEFTIMCGRYKGIDERIREKYVTHEISVGDYVLSGGEPAALILVDSVLRLLPHVLGDFDSAEGDSFTTGLLDHPHYTRPQLWNDDAVPEVLTSGHHSRINDWRWKGRLKRTFHRRPDLLEKIDISPEDRQFLEDLKNEKHPT